MRDELLAAEARDDEIRDRVDEIEKHSPSRDPLDAALNEYVAEPELDREERARATEDKRQEAIRAQRRVEPTHGDQTAKRSLNTGRTSLSDDIDEALDDALSVQKVRRGIEEARRDLGLRLPTPQQNTELAGDALAAYEALKEHHGLQRETPTAVDSDDGLTDAERIAEHRERSRRENANLAG
jgi:hypothetical protein